MSKGDGSRRRDAFLYMSRETRSKLGAGIEGFDVLFVLFLLNFGPHPRPTLAKLAMPHHLRKKYILRFLYPAPPFPFPPRYWFILECPAGSSACVVIFLRGQVGSRSIASVRPEETRSVGKACYCELLLPEWTVTPK